MNEQLLLNKWQKLKSEDQERVLAFIDDIDKEKPEEKEFFINLRLKECTIQFLVV